MADCIVDLTYRGLTLGKGLKLTAIRPHTGYVEFLAPMPVGTAIALAADGVTVTGTVTEVREPIGGGEEPPGMTFAPDFATPAVASWWAARVSLEDAPPPPRARTRARTGNIVPIRAPVPVAGATAESGRVMAAIVPQHTMKNAAVPAPVPGTGGAPPAMQVTPEPVPDSVTQPMPTVVAAPMIAAAGIAEPAPRPPTAPLPPILPGQTGQMRSKSGTLNVPDVIIDDGQKTTVMDAIDPALLEQLTRSDEPLADDGRSTQVMEAITDGSLDDPGVSGERPAVDDGKGGPRGKRRRKAR